MTTMLLLTRRPVHQLEPAGELRLDGHSWLPGKIKAKGKLPPSVHPQGAIPVVKTVARERERLSSCVAGMHTRMGAMVVHRNGARTAYVFSFSAPFCWATWLSFSFPRYHLI